MIRRAKQRKEADAEERRHSVAVAPSPGRKCEGFIRDRDHDTDCDERDCGNQHATAAGHVAALATIAATVNYVTPVEGVKPILAKREPELANNPLIFPSKSFTKNCFTQPKLSAEELQNVTRAFDAVVNG